MQHDDLPLFAWQPPCRVLLFPLPRRVAKIRHTARMLLSKQGVDADLYWRQVVASNRKHLLRVGLSSDAVESELRAFFDAVQSELIRLSHQGHDTGGTAA